jgi:hypothetical protein
MFVLVQLEQASDADCGAAQAIVNSAASVTDAATAQTWVAGARARNTVEDEALKSEITKFIAIVEATFAGSPASPEAKSKVFGNVVTACPGFEMTYPQPR